MLGPMKDRDYVNYRCDTASGDREHPVAHRQSCYVNRRHRVVPDAKGATHVFATRSADQHPQSHAPTNKVVRIDTYQSLAAYKGADDAKSTQFVVFGELVTSAVRLWCMLAADVHPPAAVEDIKTVIPPRLLNWVASKAIPSFMNTLRDACRRYPEWKRQRG